MLNQFISEAIKFFLFFNDKQNTFKKHTINTMVMQKNITHTIILFKLSI